MSFSWPEEKASLTLRFFLEFLAWVLVFFGDRCWKNACCRDHGPHHITQPRVLRFPGHEGLGPPCREGKTAERLSFSYRWRCPDFIACDRPRPEWTESCWAALRGQSSKPLADHLTSKHRMMHRDVTNLTNFFLYVVTQLPDLFLVLVFKKNVNIEKFGDRLGKCSDVNYNCKSWAQWHQGIFDKWRFLDISLKTRMCLENLDGILT